MDDGRCRDQCVLVNISREDELSFEQLRPLDPIVTLRVPGSPPPRLYRPEESSGIITYNLLLLHHYHNPPPLRSFRFLIISSPVFRFLLRLLSQYVRPGWRGVFSEPLLPFLEPQLDQKTTTKSLL